MVSSNTYSLLTWLYTQKVEPGFAIIYFRITINSKRANISLNKKIKIDSWDNSKSKIKGNSNEARILNQFIKEEEAKVANAYRELELEGKLITSQLVKARYLGLDTQNYSFTDLFKYHNLITKDKVTKDTLNHYLTTQNYILEYIESRYKTTDVFLKELDYKFISGFELFLRNYISKGNNKPIGNNTIVKHIQRINKMINIAINLDWLLKNPFVNYKLSLEKTNREYLTENELDKIQNYYSNIPRLRLVKDLFLFSCYTGLSYIDIRNLSPDNIVKGIDGENWIMTKRQKTGTSVKVPLLEPAENLIFSTTENYRKIDFNKIFPTISNQKVNSYLKEIADACGITKNLTFHMARHTFATTVTLSNGIPIETVSKMLGHTKLTTTQIYAKIVDKKVSEDMRILKNKFSSKSRNSLILKHSS
ncbi:site-specific integrase [Wenyingzhuangia marina]|uniref:Site-specific recombinase XerD n=1 Tax=Wenyingzhuangia marina TaxID=1195760 RepID=A0A1M5S762_9FLAO|nr:site-specific integrase [Wenyingzhuangia marina]GGF79193.1 transposase [Wenyingzhuangia marina]SHH34462.1 Site-specific recombinase XerD [Wenyingzhuangia marina]